MKSKILVVDDELITRELCLEVLKKMGFDVMVTGDPIHAINYSLKENYDLIITDVKMPKMNGIELMRKIKKEKPYTPFIVITGYGTYNMAIEALREGAYDIINKPFRVEELEVSVKNTIEKAEVLKEIKRLKSFTHIPQISELALLSRDKMEASNIVIESIMKQTGAKEAAFFIEDFKTGRLTKLLSVPEKIEINNKKLQKSYSEKTAKFESNKLYLPVKVSEKNIGIVFISNNESSFTQADVETAILLTKQLGVSLENIYSFEKLKYRVNETEKLFLNTVKALIAAIDAKSIWTKGHSERVTLYSLMIANKLKLSKEDLKLTELSAILHDIGKIGTYDYLLEKPGKLSSEEYEIVKKHPDKGAGILLPAKELKNVVNIVRHHHERVDGKGYPDGLSGVKIPLISRIISVADSYDSMTSDRPYRKTPGSKNAVNELLRCSGSQFDPDIVRVFIRSLKENK